MKVGFDMVTLTNKHTDIVNSLLPLLCFNRHHPAEGLHTYSR